MRLKRDTVLTHSLILMLIYRTLLILSSGIQTEHGGRLMHGKILYAQAHFDDIGLNTRSHWFGGGTYSSALDYLDNQANHTHNYTIG